MLDIINTIYLSALLTFGTFRLWHYKEIVTINYITYVSNTAFICTAFWFLPLPMCRFACGHRQLWHHAIVSHLLIVIMQNTRQGSDKYQFVSHCFDISQHSKNGRQTLSSFGHPIRFSCQLQPVIAQTGTGHLSDVLRYIRVTIISYVSYCEQQIFQMWKLISSL